MSKERDCSTCAEPTKRPCGYWDRDDGAGGLEGGFLYECSNRDCPVARKTEADARAAAERLLRTAEENDRNGVDPEELRDARIGAGVTLYSMSRRLGVEGITPAVICDYERGRRPIPPEFFRRAMDLLGGGGARG